MLTFTTSSVQTLRERRAVPGRAAVVLAASSVPLLVIAVLAVATLLA